jgi:hypothetical protein
MAGHKHQVTVADTLGAAHNGNVIRRCRVTLQNHFQDVARQLDIKTKGSTQGSARHK